jgi:hypothetical protein
VSPSRRAAPIRSMKTTTSRGIERLNFSMVDLGKGLTALVRLR